MKISAVLFSLTMAFACLGQDVSPQQSANSASANIAVDLPRVSVEEFAGILRSALLHKLPASITVEKQHNWGHQKQVLSMHGVKAVHVMRNHGEWEKVTTTAQDLLHHLNLGAYHVSSPRENRIAFKLTMEMPATVDIQKRVWNHGVRMLARHGHARVRIKMIATLETGMNPTWTGEEVLTRVAALQVTNVRVRCENFVVQNVDGIGGDAAKAAGCLLEQSFKPWRWTIESDFQKIICDAIQCAGTTPAIRLGLVQLLSKASAARAAEIEARIDEAAFQASFSQYGPRVRRLPQTTEESAAFLLELQLYGGRGHATHHAGDIHPNHAEHHVDHAQHVDPPAHAEHSGHSGSLNTHHEESRKK